MYQWMKTVNQISNDLLDNTYLREATFAYLHKHIGDTETDAQITKDTA